MITFKMHSKFICLIIVFLLVLGIRPFSPPAFAMHMGVGDMHDGVPIGPVEPKPQEPHKENPGEDPKKDEYHNEPEDKCEQPKSQGSNGSEGDPIYLFDGKFFYYHTDIRLPGSIPLKIGRSYDSSCQYNGSFGFGWSFTYNMRIFKLSDGSLLLRRGSNTKDTFTYVGSNTYQGPAGSYQTIVINGDGTYTLNQKDGYKYQFDINGCLSAIEDRNGNSVRMTYDPAGKYPINGISPYSNITTPIVIAYDWRLTKVEQYHSDIPTSIFVEFFYNDDGRITRVSDSTGRQVLYTYDANGSGDLLTMQDPEGNLYNYAYQGHLMTSYSGLGCSDCGLYTNTYDAEKRVIKQTHGNQVVDIDYLVPKTKTKITTSIYNDETLELLQKRYEYYEFNSNGFVTKFTRQMGLELDEQGGSEADDIVTSYTYNANNELTQRVVLRGPTTNHTYDSKGNILTETQMIDDVNIITTTCTYEPIYNHMTSKVISSTAEARIYRTNYTYDANGNLATETAFAVSNEPNTAMVTRYTYDGHGNILTITDPMGNVTTNEYDTNGFLARVYDPCDSNHQTLYTYDALGNMLSTTDARGNTTTFEYDDLGRVIKITDPLDIETINTYSGANLVQIEEGKTAAEAGRVSVFEYDGLNQRTAVKMIADGNEVTITRYTYDSEGRILTTTDGNGNTTTNTYDELGRLVAVADPNGFTTTFAYDEAGNVIQTTDAENHSTRYVYDYANRLTDVNDALSNVTRYTYDALGNILTVTDAKGHTTTHTYDDTGRLLQVVDPCGHTTQYTYDKNGNMIKKITPNEYGDPCGADPIIYTYDRYNQLWNVSYPDGDSIMFSYNKVGNMTGWSYGMPAGEVTYDRLNRPIRVSTLYIGFYKSISYTYNRFGERETMTNGEGQVTTYNYNALGRLTDIIHPGNLTTHYAYDTTGRLTEKTLPNGVKTTYTYDVAGRLKQLVNAKAGGSIISSFGYTNDKVGNRLSMTTTEGTHNYGYDGIYQLTSATHPSQPAETYTYDAVGNRLTSTAYNNWTYDNCNRLLSYNGATFTYDASGNTKSKTDTNGTTTYTYDYENRLVSVTTPSHTASYAYDPSGKRLSKTVDAVTTYFLYDKEDIIAEYNSSGTLATKYYHGQGIDEPIAMILGGTVYYYTFDGLGSVSELTNAAGLVAESYTYDAFGNLGTPPETGNSYAYTSREYSHDTGLYYYRTRYYDASTGRFITKDSLRFGRDYNFYIYCSNNPINRYDSFGLEWKLVSWRIILPATISLPGTFIEPIGKECKFKCGTRVETTEGPCSDITGLFASSSYEVTYRCCCPDLEKGGQWCSDHYTGIRTRQEPEGTEEPFITEPPTPEPHVPPTMPAPIF